MFADNNEDTVRPSFVLVLSMTINGALAEVQILLFAVYYKAINTKIVNCDQLICKIHCLLFSTSTRIGFMLQLLKEEGYFMSLYNKVPIESHSLSNLVGLLVEFKVICVII